MTEGHPASDLFYFLYVNCDGDFRRKYEDLLFRNYFSVFSGYVTSTKEGGGEQALLATYEEFKAEAERERKATILKAMMVRLRNIRFNAPGYNQSRPKARSKPC